MRKSDTCRASENNRKGKTVSYLTHTLGAHRDRVALATERSQKICQIKADTHTHTLTYICLYNIYMWYFLVNNTNLSPGKHVGLLILNCAFN